MSVNFGDPKENLAASRLCKQWRRNREIKERNLDKITVAEFKTFMKELIEQKGGALPDFNDWKEIKQKLDRLVDEKETQQVRDEYINKYYFNQYDSEYDVGKSECEESFQFTDTNFSINDQIANIVTQQMADQIDDEIISMMMTVDLPTSALDQPNKGWPEATPRLQNYLAKSNLI